MKFYFREITFGQIDQFWREVVKAILFQPENIVDLGEKGEHAAK